MSNKPLVTVITPSYNHAQYIEQAIESIAAQTYKKIEYFIVDDGSSDDSHELLTRLQKKYPSYIFEIHKENKGHIRISETVKKAKGEFICILSSDDWYLPEKIEKQVARFSQLDETWGIVHTNGFFFDEKSNETTLCSSLENVKEGSVLKELLERKFTIFPISPMYRKIALEKYQFLNEYKALGEGINLLIAQKFKLAFIDSPLAVMRKHDYNVGKKIVMMLNDSVGFKTYLFNHSDFPKNLQYLKPKILSFHRYIKGWEMIRILKMKKEGRKQLILAIKSNPRLIITQPRTLIGIIISFF